MPPRYIPRRAPRMHNTTREIGIGIQAAAEPALQKKITNSASRRRTIRLTRILAGDLRRLPVATARPRLPITSKEAATRPSRTGLRPPIETALVARHQRLLRSRSRYQLRSLPEREIR